MTGPPFSITPDMLEALFASRFDLDLIETGTLEGGFKGRIPAQERAWILHPLVG